MASDKVGPSPPWFVTGPDGRVQSILAIHDRLLHHPDLQRRGIILREPMKPGCVYCTDKDTPPVYAVKILNPHTEEVAIQARVLSEIRRPDNHTLPAEMTTAGHPLLIMPAVILLQDKPVLVLSLSDIMDVVFQIIEGVVFLHSLQIAHMDICMGNLLLGSPFEPFTDPSLPSGIIANRIYIIDFGQSKQFALGPGVQHAIKLPEAQIPPPDGVSHFDPYAWDVHCVGRTMQELMEMRR
ncbi:uncharacterized protein TRAVEDRAFT_49306 [Trametes versicolor FP-101664 SS1]|uniref:uncharacterized protein n=1 Tax=Trametes versicolor (strain FP-101664) TaxID=717944 RepID=UPI0004623C40|nr:uncharacterized protein TRAVEDRAFT_49306 [Trametes versicolor FP-101664 SS1]EIW56481.1 hypothetical protein TRAVEDRAFT_49306 [Trametes versicolor FP-101664 SS1]